VKTNKDYCKESHFLLHLLTKEAAMPQTQTMSLHDKLQVAVQCAELCKQGKDEEAIRLMIEKVPLPPFLAKSAKRTYGADFLIENGYDLSEAEAEFGPGWLRA
jgi:hypothetical protein